MSSVSFQNLFKNLGQGYTSLDPSQIDANGNPVNNNLTGFGLTAADIKKLATSPTGFLAGVTGPDATISNAAGNAVYQPLDGLSVAGAYQNDGRASVQAQKMTGASQPVYPTGFTDGSGNVLRASAVDAGQFQSWTTGYQKEFIYDELFASGMLSAQLKTTGIPTTADIGLLKQGFSLTIGTGGSAVHVVLGPSLDANGKQILENQVKVIVVENLTKTKFATMTLAEQTLVANTSYFQTTLSVQLGLKVNPAIPTTAPSTLASTIATAFATAIATIAADAQSVGVSINPTTGAFGGVGATNENTIKDGRMITYDDVKIFLDEIAALKAQVANMAILSDDSIQTKIDAIKQRYMQVSAFGSVPNQMSAADVAYGYHDTNGNIDNAIKLTKNVVSLDTSDTTGNSTTAPDGTGITRTQQTIYLHALCPHNINDARRIPADAFITPDDVGSLKTTYGVETPFYVKDPDGTLRELKQGAIVQVNAFGQLIGTVVDKNGKVVGGADGTALGQPGNTPRAGGVLNDIFSPRTLSLTGTGLVGGDQNLIAGGNYRPVGVSYGQENNGDQASFTDMPIVKYDIPVTTSGKTGVNSTNQSTIASGYGKLISAERTTLSLQNQMDQVAKSQTISTGTAGVDKSLDLPTLIFFMQFYTNLIKEQQVNASTEMVNQQNQLLNAYSQIQTLVNNAQSRFNAKEQTEERDLFGNLVDGSQTYTKVYIGSLVDPATNAPISQSTYNVMSMFDSVLSNGNSRNNGTNNTVLNPIEKLFNIKRPTQKLFEVGNDGRGGVYKTTAYTSTAWNSYGTSLSSAVTQINQQTQIMMNNINTLDKEKNQHFDLANNCLTKMNELMASIGRNIT